MPCNCTREEISCKKEKKCVCSEIDYYLSDCDRILFEGKYNLKDVTDKDGFLETIPCEISINKHGYNPMIVEYYTVNDKTQANLQLLDETYTLSSYKKECNQIKYDSKVGQITWTGFYPNSSTNGDTTSDFEQLTVLGGSGIYSKVTKVIIDYRKEIRKIYFICKR